MLSRFGTRSSVSSSMARRTNAEMDRDPRDQSWGVASDAGCRGQAGASQIPQPWQTCGIACHAGPFFYFARGLWLRGVSASAFSGLASLKLIERRNSRASVDIGFPSLNFHNTLKHHVTATSKGRRDDNPHVTATSQGQRSSGIWLTSLPRFPLPCAAKVCKRAGCL